MPRAFAWLLEWLAPESVYAEADQRRRSFVFATGACILVVVGCLRGVMFAASGAYPMALLFFAAAISGFLYANAMRRGWSLVWAAQIFAVQITMIMLTGVVFRGGIGATEFTINAVLALQMTYIVSARAGLFWWMVGVVSVMVLYGLQASGVVVLDDQMANDALVADAVTAVLIPTAALSVALVFEWSRLEANKSLRLAMQRQATAEKDLMIMKADKMASVGLLAAGVGHEINNPLTYAKANINFVRTSLSGTVTDHEPLIQALSDAEKGVRRLAKITTDLSTFAQPDDQAAIQPLDLSDVARSALELTRHELEQRCSVGLDLGEVPAVSAIESRLVQVAVNLLLNASDAVGRVEDGRVLLRTGADGGHAFLEVSDNGPGVPAGDQDRIFDPFFTTKPVGTGTGLGLANSRALVRAVGGTLTVQSVQGDGATFRIRLPVASKPVRSARRDLNSTKPARYRILIVDDDELVQRAIARMMRPHEVVYCQTGEAALDLLMEDDEFDLILSDVMMYPMAGWEFLDQLRKRTPGGVHHFSFMTGGAFTPAARAHLRKAKVPVLEKPFHREDVVALIEQRD